MIAPISEAAPARHPNAIAEDGSADAAPQTLNALHDDWLCRDDRTWNGEVVRRIVGEDAGAALLRRRYQDHADAEPFSSWLTFHFRNEDGVWRRAHDCNTINSTEAARRC